VLDVSTESRTLEVGDDPRFRDDAVVERRPASDSPPADPVQAEEWAISWAAERSKAKKKKDFAEADRIRDILGGAGFEVRDTPQGPEIIKR
jgi:cysteinyl-tRNA synthetase